ncbi:MAG: ATP-binding cassette domain-containing protein [Bryobacteraceae bacterium]
MSSGAILEFRDITYRIAGRAILSGINLDVHGGETVVLLGRSGSGKTTLLKTANGLVQPSSGELRFEGRATRDWDLVRLRRRMGYAIQDSGLFPHFTVEANVGLLPRLEGWQPAAIRERVELMMNKVNLPYADYAARYPRQLSGGQKQRVGIARALAADPPLLLMDEPFGALDPVTRFELQRQFLNLSRDLNKTALFVTHDIREALMLATRIVLLKDGAIETIATPDEFLKAEGAEARAFLGTL